MMVSATQLSSYSYCPRKLFIKSVLLVEEPIKSQLIKGKVWHESHEELNKLEESIVSSISIEMSNSLYQEILDIYKKNYSKVLRNIIIKHKSSLKEFDISLIDLFKEYWPHFEEESKLRAWRISEFVQKREIYGKELWEKLTPKLLSEKYFKSEELGLSGVIDVIEIHKKTDSSGNVIEEYVPVELKTGTHPGSGIWDTHKLQLGAYIILLENLGKNVTEAKIRYIGVEDRLLLMNTFLKEEVLDVLDKTKKVLKSVIPPDFVENKNKCKSCQFKETCYNKEKMDELLETLKKKKTNII